MASSTTELRFPTGFMWGAATSAHQVEGDNRGNDWWRFEQQHGVIRGDARSGDACRHYERFDSDFALAAMDGHGAHRLSLEWSRIEPAPGTFAVGAVAHYHAVFAALRRHGLTPIVTLHHFTNPLWLADSGGWEDRRTIDHFERFVRFCAREYGGEVDWWCTVNEPEVYAFRSYSEGIWPPAVRDNSRALGVIANLLEAHARAYHVLHAEDREDADGDGHAARVGFAKHRVGLEPLRAWHPLDQLLAYFENRVFNTAVERAALDGVIDLSIPGAQRVRRVLPELKGALDWYGLNQYTRWMVQSLAPDPHVLRPGAPANDLGWELHPEGFERALVSASELGRPVLVTENGFADATDRIRPQALLDHVEAMHRAIGRGANVLGYLHWSLLDNFEWADGYHGRFGLYGVDFADPERPRTRRQSAEVFARIARANAITPAARAAASLTRG
ncbi:MAG: glycoside hydrolase family 1 protein [Candidatus Eisenbacteria bacterium]